MRLSNLDLLHSYLNRTTANKALFSMIDILKANSDEVVEHYFEKIAADMSSVSDIVTILKALFVVI